MQSHLQLYHKAIDFAIDKMDFNDYLAFCAKMTERIPDTDARAALTLRHAPSSPANTRERLAVSAPIRAHDLDRRARRYCSPSLRCLWNMMRHTHASIKLYGAPSMPRCPSATAASAASAQALHIAVA